MVIKGIEGGMGVSGISLPFPSGAAGGTKPSGAAEGFTTVLGDMVKQVNNLQNQADTAVQKLATGESKGLHEVMIAMEKSSISFQFLSQVRNKAVEAYHEIMRMQV
ncbi:flagellar hook-basal body complex protein FliE [bacterium]|nr:flagellar hook-basal body complex protein FliE [bacterium]